MSGSDCNHQRNSFFSKESNRDKFQLTLRCQTRKRVCPRSWIYDLVILDDPRKYIKKEHLPQYKQCKKKNIWIQTMTEPLNTSIETMKEHKLETLIDTNIDRTQPKHPY